MRKFQLSLTIVALVLVVLFPASADAKNKPLSIEQLSRRADTVATGEVLELRASWNDKRTRIDTVAKLAVETHVKGSSSNDVLEVVVPGGRVGSDRIVVSDAPTFVEGERALLFLKKRGKAYVVIAGKQGKKTILADMLVEEKAAVSSIVDRIRADSGQVSKKVTAREFRGSTRTLTNERPSNISEPVKPLNQGQRRMQSMLGSTSASWVTMMSEGFEGSPYIAWANDYWGITDYGSYYGQYSAWCAGAIYDPWSYYYPNNLNSTLIYGPFDLSDAVDAELSFKWWNDSELNYDFFFWGASADDSLYDGISTSGYSSGWINETLDLSPYAGDATVWVAFNFTSDSLNLVGYSGAFIDNIVVRKNKIEPPRIDSVTPTSGSAGTNTRVTIKGTHFGASPGDGGVAFLDPAYVVPAPIISWSDTQIVVEVPADASSGDICVVSDTNGVASISNPMPFKVTFAYSGARWADSSIPVGYRINTHGTPDVEDEFQAIHAAFDTWSNISTSKMVFSFEGTTSAVGFDNNDGRNTISFDPGGLASIDGAVDSNAVAVVITRLSGSTIVEQDIVFNDQLAWSSTGEPNKYDIQSVTTHEAGHMLCLFDLYGDVDAHKTMYGFGGPGETHMRTLEPEDIAGATYIYYTDDKIPPSPPASLEATASIESVKLSWGVANDNNGLAGYSVYRSQAPGGPYSKVSTTLIQGTSFNDRNLTPDIPYYYVVTAVDTAGNTSVYSNEASATPQRDTIAPSAPAGFKATAQANAVMLSWNANSEEDLAGYIIYRNTTDTSSSAVRINPASISKENTSFADTVVTNGKTYFYWLAAVDLAHTPNESGLTASVSATPYAPTGGGGGGGSAPSAIAAPTNLKAAATTSSIILSWDKVDKSPGYNIYRRAGSGGFQKLNTSLVTTNSFSDDSCRAGVAYAYYVVSVDVSSQESSRSNEIVASLLALRLEMMFSDIHSNAWYKESVSSLIALDIIGGYPDGTFKPERNITRAEFAKITCLAMGWELSIPKAPTFRDVEQSDWAYAYIETAKMRGVAGGYADGTFKPTKSITRAEIAKMVAETLSLPSGGSSFTDMRESWARAYIASCVKAGIVSGYPDNTFRPDNTATRAEASNMIVGLLANK